MLTRNSLNSSIILGFLALLVVVVFLFLAKKNQHIFFKSTCSCNSTKLADEYDSGHNFRRLNRLITDYDSYVAAKVKALAERKAPANDSEVIQLARQMIDYPRKEMTKLGIGVTVTAQSKAIDEILKGQKGGKYIECGGYDGEVSSPTVFFEAHRGWTGLLVEVDPSYYTQLVGKQRNVFSINACLSPMPYFTMMTYRYSHGQLGKVENQINAGDVKSKGVPCFPTETLLLALNWTTVDFFSLDVEGAELPILKTIPWDKYSVRTLTVEYRHGPTGKAGYISYMVSKGFKLEKEIKYGNSITGIYIKDLVFSKL